MNRTEYHREYRRNNPEKIEKIRKEFFERHPHARIDYINKWRENHREEYNAYMREYYHRKKAERKEKNETTK